MSEPGRPTVTIGVPVYDGERYLAQMLESLAAQTYEDFEVVVSDNASTDRSVEIARDFAARDPRIVISRSPVNRGAGWNFNRVLELGRGRYFKWQAHDDLVAPTYLERCVAALEADPGVVVAHTGVEMVDESLELIERYGIRLRTDDPDPVVRFAEQVLRWNLCYDVFGLIRREALDRTEGMGNFSHGDGVLLAHLALLGRSELIDEPLFRSRQHELQSARQFGHDGGGNDYHDYAVWFDPSLDGRLTFPNWSIIGAYHRVIRLTDGLSARDRARLEWVLARRARQDVRLLAGDAAYAARFGTARLRGALSRRR